MTKLINIETIIADKSKPVDFANLDEASFAPAVKNLIAKVRQTMQAVIDSEEKPTWENVVDPLDNVLEDLQFVWSIISHLNSVVDTPHLEKLLTHYCRIFLFYLAKSVRTKHFTLSTRLLRKARPLKALQKPERELLIKK